MAIKYPLTRRYEKALHLCGGLPPNPIPQSDCEKTSNKAILGDILQRTRSHSSTLAQEAKKTEQLSHSEEAKETW